MKSIISIRTIQSGSIGALNLGLDIESLRINALIIDLFILVIIGLAVQVAWPKIWQTVGEKDGGT